jgi:ferredoxin--NADP+ reductase
MTHVVTSSCCADASCVFACPVNAIHPTPDEPDFHTAEMVYIDPASCVDCAACVTACPTGAISAARSLGPAQAAFIDLNAAFFAGGRSYPPQAPVEPIRGVRPGQTLRVAVVGAGPAGLYAADDLLKRPGVQVNVFDRLPTPYGLVRAGVAPDHPETKGIERLFRQIESQPGFTYYLNVDVGQDITHEDLLAHHHAVIYASGASADARLGIGGEDLPGSDTATHFVAWYNGHPDHAQRTFDLSGRTAVVVGNGNVALDVARILTAHPDDLVRTDMADHALDALRHSNVERVEVLGRRSAAHAAFTVPELMSLMSNPRLNFEVHGDDLRLEPADRDQAAKVRLLREAVERPMTLGARTISFRFLTSPVACEGNTRVERVRTCANRLVATDGRQVAVRTDRQDTIEASLVLRSVGYRATPVTDLPFDHARAVVPNTRGRVDGVTGAYVAGWIKRGPTGFIGTNKSCSAQSVDALIEDFNAGRLPSPLSPPGALDDMVQGIVAHPISLSGWRAIDRHERREGLRQGRPRRKLVSRQGLIAVASARESAPQRVG